MKISKSKQELARIIRENGGWRDGAESAAQCINGEISFWSNTARKDPGFDWYGHYLGKVYDIKFTGVKLANWHQTLLSPAEYFHFYPARDADGWIEWKGGECPVEDDAVIDIRFRDGNEERGVHADWDWEHSGGGDIIAYRLHKPEQKKPDPAQVEEAKPTIEQLAADYRNKLDYANRKQDEADKANMESDAALSQLEDAIAAIGFAITPLAATEKEPELGITVQVGDEVECVKSNIKPGKYKGMIGTVLEVDDSSTPYLVEFGGEENIWCHEVKFIRRPT